MLTNFCKMKHHHQTIFAIIIAVAVISLWRGIWGLMDEYLLPNHYELSLWLSVAIGLAILIGTHYATKELM
ncbi:hypothetical protein KY325_00465 [Candidatus Woesearchaeota archaeon]|nr:hypothetical protein [Candidatus Woesearchaeota archaeon]MBW3017617.1 hypothetical protein [Candidatus Woesearchaeota archaeon]